MKNKQTENSNSDNKLAWGLILGFMGGVLFDNVALGLILGVVFGSFTNFTNMKKK